MKSVESVEVRIDFKNFTASTQVGVVTANVDELYTIMLNACFSNKVTTLYVYADYVTSRLLKAMRIAVAKQMELVYNNKYIETWEDLRPFACELYDYVEAMQSKEIANTVLNIIVSNKELMMLYIKGLDALHTFLDGYISNSGYDVGMSSPRRYDKLSHGRYVDSKGVHEYHLNYTPTGVEYHTSLLDKLRMYQSIRWYENNGLEPEHVEKDMDIVVPVSACSLSVQMWFE